MISRCHDLDEIQRDVWFEVADDGNDSAHRMPSPALGALDTDGSADRLDDLVE
jgi:hypothetical protein